MGAPTLIFLIMEEQVFKPYHPDLSRYNEILINNGQPMNDINFVQSERAEVASLYGNTIQLNENFESPLDMSEEDAFESFIPKGVQTPDEISSYIDYIKSKDN